jgi:flotillin
VIINTGGDGGAGASRVTQDVASIIAQVPATVEALTGVDLVETISNLPVVKGARKGKGEEGKDKDKEE